jgi:hypothetical protein
MHVVFFKQNVKIKAFSQRRAGRPWQQPQKMPKTGHVAGVFAASFGLVHPLKHLMQNVWAFLQVGHLCQCFYECLGCCCVCGSIL